MAFLMVFNDFEGFLRVSNCFKLFLRALWGSLLVLVVLKSF